MKLKYKTGIEFAFTYAPPVEINDPDDISHRLEGAIGGRLRSRGLYPRIDAEAGGLELNYEPFTTWAQIADKYTRTLAVMKEFGFGVRCPGHDTAGGQIHQSGFKSALGKLAVLRLVRAHPEINWAMNGTGDDTNAQPWPVRVRSAAFFKDWAYFKPSRDPYADHGWHIPAIEAMGGMDTKDFAISFDDEWGTVEHRYIDAPDDLAHLKRQVMFVDHLSAYAERHIKTLIDTPPEYPNGRRMRKTIGVKGIINRFCKLVEDIGLNPADYRPDAALRIKERVEMRTLR